MNKISIKSNARWVRPWLIYFIVLLILILIFLSYFAPDMMVALSNQVWTMCGW